MSAALKNLQCSSGEQDPESDGLSGGPPTPCSAEAVPSRLPEWCSVHKSLAFQRAAQPESPFASFLHKIHPGSPPISSTQEEGGHPSLPSTTSGHSPLATPSSPVLLLASLQSDLGTAALVKLQEAKATTAAHAKEAQALQAQLAALLNRVAVLEVQNDCLREKLTAACSELPAKDAAYEQLQDSFFRLQHMYVAKARESQHLRARLIATEAQLAGQ